MAIDVAVRFLKIVGTTKARNQEEIPQVRDVRKETLIVELTVAY